MEEAHVVYAAADMITSDVDAWGPSPGNDLKINLIIASNS